MGGQVSVLNSTPYKLAISLNQVGPLYYDNNVVPNETFQRNVGAVWFTVKAIVNPDGNSIYSDWSVAAPIVAITGGAILAAVSAGSLAVAYASAATGISGTAAWFVPVAIEGSFLTAITIAAGFGTSSAIIGLTIEAAKALEDALRNPASVGGVYAGNNPRLKVVGGKPKNPQQVKSQNGENLIHFTEVEPIRIEYI